MIRKEKKDYVGSETPSYINEGKADALARTGVSLLHQGKGRVSEGLEGDKPPPAPDQDLESNWIFQERVSLMSVCVHRAQNVHVT